MRRTASIVIALVGLTAVVGTGCNGVLGIDQATFDPTVGSDAASDAPSGPCADYCNQIQSVCTATFKEYIDVNTCLAFCAVWDPGAPSDTAVDTLACRVNKLAAAQDAGGSLALCDQAGPTGGNVCGDPCHNFCQLDQSLCDDTALTMDPLPYPDQATCLSQCAAYATDMSGQGIALIEAGDTLQCRYYHLEASQQAVAGDLHTHCPHTAQVSETCFDLTPADAGTDAGTD